MPALLVYYNRRMGRDAILQIRLPQITRLLRRRVQEAVASCISIVRHRLVRPRRHKTDASAYRFGMLLPERLFAPVRPRRAGVHAGLEVGREHPVHGELGELEIAMAHECYAIEDWEEKKRKIRG